MEFVGNPATWKAHSIGDKLDLKGPELNEDDWYDVMIDITTGLNVMHQNGILNNDLQENNVLLIQGEDRWHAKLIDFGMSSEMDEPFYLNMTEEAKVEYEYLNKHGHYAPECALDDEPSSVSSDVYELGSLMGLVGQEMKIGALLDMAQVIVTASPGQRPTLQAILQELNFQRYGDDDI